MPGPQKEGLENAKCGMARIDCRVPVALKILRQCFARGRQSRTPSRFAGVLDLRSRLMAAGSANPPLGRTLLPAQTSSKLIFRLLYQAVNTCGPKFHRQVSIRPPPRILVFGLAHHARQPLFFGVLIPWRSSCLNELPH